MANTTWTQGMEHSWVARPARTTEGRPPRRRRFVLSDWLPAAILARGGRADRETERALGDLRAIHAARETGR
ncbi:hypothetical protein [Leifsonia sp. 21MFCrub1.1]|uniref:hypothetical protein n=1 Tax=Leifsonia sp. 21MFCrub1.1 TaxID=1798223 RepID=UPI001E5EDFAD|nr:hypothetical protein [Leifsonia sp. 21MFCrub1.1]